MPRSVWALILLTWALAGSKVVAASPGIRIAAGAGSFLFVDAKGDPTREITVYTYLPKRVAANAAPIVFVLHGHHRTAKGYRDDWAQHADKYGFMVLAPLFEEEKWATSSPWSYSVIEHLFDGVKAATGNASARYYLYGFSEGGQFVHRLVLLLPEARYARAVAGTPGWYTMPRFDIRFPYGLDRSPATEQSLKTSLGRDVVLMLGGADTDPNHPGLNKSRQAEAQGPNRVARGQAFFKEAADRAAHLHTAFGWRLRVVPGVAHEPSKMSGPAAAALMDKSL